MQNEVCCLQHKQDVLKSNSKSMNNKKSLFLSKRALAQCYFPNILPESAVRCLDRWIHKCTDLSGELQRVGYAKRQRNISHRQLELIFKYLGEP
ncbi:MAG: DUF4248 domain-containing protein [Bacteroidales bacterium]